MQGATIVTSLNITYKNPACGEAVSYVASDRCDSPDQPGVVCMSARMRERRNLDDAALDTQGAGNSIHRQVNLLVRSLWEDWDCFTALTLWPSSTYGLHMQ